jgi:YVTN family beta-propeller protein
VLVDTRPRMALFTPDGRFAWVSSEIRGTVTVIDAENREIARRIGFRIPGVSREMVQAVGMAITRNGKRAFVALGPANRVAEIDPATMEVLRYHLVGPRVWHIALSPDDRRLYAANGNSSDVSVIDLERNEVIRSLGVGRSPWGIVVAP